MDLPKRIILPCGNAAILLNDKVAQYTCNYCDEIVGSNAEPEACKKKRENAEPFKNDYWMDINAEPDEINRR
jgi:hypothetical protein